MGRSHLATFCPICRHFIRSADGPSADGTVPSGYILPNLLTFCPISILDKNVPRWAVPSADGPIWLCFAQSADGTSAYGTSHLPTLSPICRHFVPSAYWTKCSRMGHPVCQQARLQTGQNVCRWAVPFADRPVCRRDASPDGPEHMHCHGPELYNIIHKCKMYVEQHVQQYRPGRGVLNGSMKGWSGKGLHTDTPSFIDIDAHSTEHTTCRNCAQVP